MEPVPHNIDIDQWVSSNAQLLSLLTNLNRDGLTNLNGKDSDAFASFLSCISHAPNLQPLIRCHALRFWNEILGDDQRHDIVTQLQDPNFALQRKGIADIYALLKFYIPIVDPPIPFAVPVWKVSDWTNEWQDMAEKMNDDSLYDIFPGLSRKIHIPANVNELDWDWDFVSTSCSRSEGQDISEDIAKDVFHQLHSIKDNFWLQNVSNRGNQSDPSNSFRTFFSTPLFGNGGQGAWEYKHSKIQPGRMSPTCIYLYPVKHGNTWLSQQAPSFDWFVSDKHEFPGIIANTVFHSKYHGEHQLWCESIGILYIVRAAIAKLAQSVQSQRVSIMALHISYFGVERCIFSFCTSQPETIQYWHKYFDFKKLEDLGRLWLELWNSRTIFLQQSHGVSWYDVDQDICFQYFNGPYQSRTSPPTSAVIISRGIKSIDYSPDLSVHEQRKKRLAWLNSFLRKQKYRVCNFIQTNVARIVDWTTFEAVEYAKYFSDDSHELSIHKYLLSLPHHPHNRTVPILYFKEDPDGHIVCFTPNVGEVLGCSLKPPKVFLGIALQICQAVNFMHQHGVAHLDLRRENIMVSSDNHVTIIDFSCSFYIPPPPGFIQEAVGTYGYVAPEVENGIPYNPVLADVYSLGQTFHRVAGHSLYRHICYPEFRKIVQTMNVKDPMARASLSSVISCIEALIAEPSFWEHLGKKG